MYYNNVTTAKNAKLLTFERQQIKALNIFILIFVIIEKMGLNKLLTGNYRNGRLINKRPENGNK